MVLFHVTIQIAMRKKIAFIYLFILLASCILSASCSKATSIDPKKLEKLHTGIEKEDQTDEEDVETVPENTYNSFDIVGVDHFGRSFQTITGYKKNRQVGLFFWLWIGQPYANGIYDATKIAALPNGIRILTDFNLHDETISPNGQAHFWGEPIWGYYNSEDEWVIRKQMQMLTIAGVDFIYFDTTNAFTYPNVFLQVCKVIDEMIQNNWNPPRVVFYTHSRSFQTVRTLFKEFYKPNLYPDTWYRVNDKPMLIAYNNPADDVREASSRNDTNYDPGVLSAEILNFFHFMKPQWPSDPIYPDGFPWIEWTFPQPLHAASQVMSVSVASHPMVPMSFSLTRENWTNWGRGWSTSLKRNISSDVDKGTFFQSQWNHAIQTDPPMISVGGWNEWIAYKQPWDGEYMLCDAANKEYSRDIEPMQGGYQDAFYLQLIDNIRRYKGVKGTVEANVSKMIDINGAFSQWKEVTYIVHNPDKRFIGRDAYGAARTVRYTEKEPTDPLVEIRVAHDTANIYFYLKGKHAFSDQREKENGLIIFIGTGDPGTKEWESYEYIIGNEISEGNISIGQFQNGFSTKNIGNGKIARREDVIQIRIPRTAIGLSTQNRFYFKVAMDVADPSDIMHSYQSGVSMPMGRLSYMYKLDH